MNTNNAETNLNELYPLPPGIKLRKRHFPRNAVSNLKDTPAPGDRGDNGSPRPVFELMLEERIDLGSTTVTLWVRIQERFPDGVLLGEVHCSDASLLNTGVVSVALSGTEENHLIRKTIPLTKAEKDGCSGSIEFCLLQDAIRELGTKLQMSVFLMDV
jgi:hypothetical protein